MKSDSAFIKEEALNIISRSCQKITPSNLEKNLCRTFSINRAAAKQVIKDLVSAEELAYTNFYGRTFLETSFGRPVQITSRILLCPPHRNPSSDIQGIRVKILPGVSFGSGGHPTTRLCLQGLTYVLDDNEKTKSIKGSRCLDIGTGSGVLLIAALKLGMANGLGLDIDPNAIFEARQNASLNGLESRTRIGNIRLESVKGPFRLIMANLRYPTLMALSSQLSHLAHPYGVLVLSGFRPEEFPLVFNAYGKEGFEEIWHGEEINWVSTVLMKRGTPGGPS
jgi:ribosomal protein L11 methyltransferase